MAKFSDNYYLRDCFLKRKQVPTQTVMIKKMCPPLAAVYFKSMPYKLKVLAGLEPPMKGGGSDWFMPPNDLLEGRAVLKPTKKEYLSKLNYLGVDSFGMRFLEIYHKQMEDEKNKAILESDINWKKNIEMNCRMEWDRASKEAAAENTEKIQNAFNEFTTLYTTSITKVELLLFEAAVEKIKSVEQEVFQRMSDHYEVLLKQQVITLYDKYTEKLMKHQAKLKSEFIENVEKSRTGMGDRVHDIKVEKHVAVEKLRQYLECQNMACQVYVALKEREECSKEMTLSTHEHEKKVKVLTEQIAYKDFEIRLAVEKEKKRQEFNRVWKKKVCHVVKKFQMFVSYCLSALPEHAEFFLNMEKLMLLQLDEALEDPSVESIFVPEQEKFHTPVPRPHPFYLFCDKGYKVKIDQNLCPKRCTSSASQLPVIIINKRCIYAACDNFEKFTDKVKGFIHGERGQDADFDDYHMYQHDVPVQYTPSMQLTEIKLESSLLQILQKELPNIKQVPIECCVCKIPHCFCSPLHASKMSLHIPIHTDLLSIASISSGNKIETRTAELEHEREPKWDSYFKHVEPRRCQCAKKVKKHLTEHMPPYMKNVSIYDEPEIPNYERCSVATLRRLVTKARGKRPPSPPLPVVPSRTKDMSTQYSDQEFDWLCTCFSDEEVKRIFNDLITNCKLFDQSKTAPQFRVVGDSMSSTHLNRQPSEFATERAYSLKNLVDASPELKEIFMKRDCKFK